MINYNNKVLQSIKKYKGDWFHKQFHAYPLTLGCIATGALQQCFKILPDFQKMGITFYTKEIADWYWRRDEQLVARKRVIKAQLKDINFICKINKHRHEAFLEFVKHWKNFIQLNLKDLTLTQIWQAYIKVTEPLYKQWGYGVVSEPFLGTNEDWFTDELKLELTAQFGQKWSDVINIIGLPNTLSFVNKEHLSLLRIAQKLVNYKDVIQLVKRKKIKNAFVEAKNKKDFYLLLKKHTEDFFWIEDNYCVWRRYNEFTFFKRATKLAFNNPSKILRVEEQRIKNQLSFKAKILNKLSLRAKKLVVLANTLSESSDERKTTSFRMARVWFSLAQEVARRSTLTEQDVLHMVDVELKDFLLHGNTNKKLLVERQKRCLLVHLPGGNLMYSGKSLHGLMPKDFERVDKSSKTFTGVCACLGMARGRVRVVIKYQQIAQVKKGEILVTNNTTPDYVPAMRKAAAIITEQGGITSHAALISRELGVPCIIGTRIATKVLKTGDLVEVDANSGIVRKLN